METQNNEHVGVINPDTTREELLAMKNDPNITILKINMTPEEWSQMLIRINVPMVTLNKECIMEEQHAEVIRQSLEERRAQMRELAAQLEAMPEGQLIEEWRRNQQALAAQLEEAGVYQPNALGFTDNIFMAVISM